MAEEKVSGANIETGIFDIKFFKHNYSSQLRNTDQKLRKEEFWV